VVVYIAWPLALVIQSMVVAMIFRAKLTFLNLRFAIPIHFLVEFLFTMTFIELSADDMGFRTTLALHGLTDCMLAFNLLFRRQMMQALFPWVFVAWTATTAMGVILYYPLNLVLGASLFVVPMDVMTFLGSVALIRRTTNDRARRAGYLLMFHMVSGFIIFAMFLAKTSFGYALIVNGAHVLICCYLWFPIAQMNDTDMVTQGIIPELTYAKPKSDDAATDGSVQLAVKGDEEPAGTPPAVTATDIFSPARLENPKHTMVLGGAIMSAFFLALLIGVFVSYRTSFWDLVESPYNYYHPGAIDAI